MKQKRVGYVYFTSDGNIAFDISDLHYEHFAPKPLIEIKSVVSLDKESGTLVIDTNYGEEYIDLYSNESMFSDSKFHRDFINNLVFKIKKSLCNVDCIVVDIKRSKKQGIEKRFNI